MICQELFLTDVVAVDVFRLTAVHLSVPFNVPALTNLSNVVLPNDVALHIGMSDTISFDNPATVKVSSSRKRAGNIYAHELSCTLTDGISDAQSAISDIQNEDLLVVSKTSDGTRYMHYSCPGTSNISLEDNISDSSHTASLKITLSSLSPMIKITE